MDCYILALKKLLSEKHLSEEEFVFLTNYSITRCWTDTEASSTFDVPIIFPAWFPNIEDIRYLYPHLRQKSFDSFSDYLSFIKSEVKKSTVVIPFDRYYLDYLEPKRHMGAHYVCVEAVSEEVIFYFDFVDNNRHSIAIATLEKATERTDHPYQYMGRTVLFKDESGTPDISLNFTKIGQILSRRVEHLNESLLYIREFIQRNVKDQKLCHFYLKIALGGITYSDFFKKNGRYENYLFLKKVGMHISAAFAWMFCNVYVILAYLFFLLYKRTTTTERQWKLFCRIYSWILRAETGFYERLLNRKQLISDRLIDSLMNRE